MKFIIQPHKGGDKSFEINAEGTYLSMEVDYDDVDREEVDMLVEKMVAILNEHWNDQKYDTKKTEIANWFIKLFNEITEEEQNGETAEDVKVEFDDKGNIIIEFTVDGDRYGRHDDNKVVINIKRNYCSVKLCEFIESGGVPGRLHRLIDGSMPELKIFNSFR